MFKILDEEKPEYLTVTFDVHAPTFRHEMFADYKGTRKPMAEELRQQVPVIKDVLRAMHIEVIEKAGLEADDLLGTLSHRCEEKGMDVSIISGDRDTLQLATVVMTGVDGKTLRPDMIVHLPGGKTIPIDAKVPYADYQRACMIPETAGPEDLERRDELLRSHAKALREHVRALGDKAYWSACDTAPDFVIAFIPNEALLQAAMEADPTLMDDAFARKVALTSPVTLWAVLKSVAYAWQQQSLTDDAKTLFDLSRELYERFAVLGERANKLGTALTRTVTAYNQFASSLESRVLVTARKLQKLDQATVIGSVNIIDPDKSDVREITAPETTSE